MTLKTGMWTVMVFLGLYKCEYTGYSTETLETCRASQQIETVSDICSRQKHAAGIKKYNHS